MAFRLTFHGGAGTVTGSNFLAESGDARVLVDCGIEQGRDFCAESTYSPFPYDVPSIDALIITHAHLDHIGRAPKLMREGFKGKVYMTEATRDLTELMLRDSVGLLAEEAKRNGLAPLYEDADVTALMERVIPIGYHEKQEVAPGVTVLLRHTGHILGSASVTLMDNDTTLAITGDIGNTPSPYLPDWEKVPDADALVMESVYGDRVHPHRDTRASDLRDAFTKALGRGSDVTILMPAFSLERTQLMLYELSNLFAAGELPEFPVFLDSPLAIKATEVYEKHAADFNAAAQAEMKQEGSIFRFPFLTMTPSREESQAIEEVKGPKLIIAGAGMSHGGRIGRWEEKYLGNPSTTLFIVGYQAPGSPGRLLQDGSKSVRINGRPISVRAKIETLHSWSAHADRDGLLAFAEAALPSAKTVFVAIGEPNAERFLAQRIHGFLGGNAVVPQAGETWEITKSGSTRVKA